MSSVSAASGAGSSILAQQGGTQAMGKDDFLKLLVTQLQNQDPLNPSDPTEFTAQLAQFSSLEQLFAVNSSLDRLSTVSGDMERISALGLIGKDFTAYGDFIRLGDEGARVGYHLEASAMEVNLHVLDANGNIVASIPGSETGAGEHFFDWDGKDQHGDPIPPGEYALVVTALNEEKESVPAWPLIKGTVTGVDLGSGGSILVSSVGDFRLQDIVRVGRG